MLCSKVLDRRAHTPSIGISNRTDAGAGCCTTRRKQVNIRRDLEAIFTPAFKELPIVSMGRDVLGIQNLDEWTL